MRSAASSGSIVASRRAGLGVGARLEELALVFGVELLEHVGLELAVRGRPPR